MKRLFQFLMLGLGLTLVPWKNAHGIEFVLSYPLIGQQETNWCWAATDQMLRQYYSDNAQQCQIANFGLNKNNCCDRFPAPSDCNKPSGLSFLKMSGIYSYQPWAGGISYSRIRTQLLNFGRPVIYTIQYVGGSGVGHVRTITGISDEGGLLLVHESLPVGTGSQIWIPHSNYVGSHAIGYMVNNTYTNIIKL